MRTTTAQLELDLLTPPTAARPGLVVTRALRRHRSCRRLIERVRYVRRYFPELEGVTLKVGLTRAASGMAVPGGDELWLNPFRISYHTIAHELVHLLQRRGLGIPEGERSCDVYALARHWTLNDVAPTYVEVPGVLVAPDGSLTPAGSRTVFGVARDALARRASGHRTYIAWFESQLRELASAPGLPW